MARRSTKQRRAAARRNCAVLFMSWFRSPARVRAYASVLGPFYFPPCLCRPINPQHEGTQ